MRRVPTVLSRTVALALLLHPAAQALRAAGASALIIQDERPQMEVLARYLEEAGGISCTIVDQAHVPDDLAHFAAVIVYIHGTVQEPAEVAFIEYTRAGGRCVCLHHTISRSHGRNRYLFDFLGIRLDPGPAQAGGYTWNEGVTYTLVNLAPAHYITSHNVEWGEPVAYTPSDAPSAEGLFPAITLEETEVYLNHRFTDGRAKTVLAGFLWKDPDSDRVWMQDRAIWLKPFGAGHVVYMQVGHASSDFANRNVAQLVLNAVRWNPCGASPRILP